MNNNVKPCSAFLPAPLYFDKEKIYPTYKEDTIFSRTDERDELFDSNCLFLDYSNMIIYDLTLFNDSFITNYTINTTSGTYNGQVNITVYFNCGKNREIKDNKFQTNLVLNRESPNNIKGDLLAQGG